MENLIYDRTQKDLEENTSKGYYNCIDLNRVEEWCEYLANLLNSYSYPVNIQVKTNWQMSDFPTSSEMERIIQNVNDLKEAYFAFTEIPANLEYTTIEKANDIEKILSEIDFILTSMKNNFIYCGVASCGQARMWQQRYRRKSISAGYEIFITKDGEELNDSNSNLIYVKGAM